MSLTIRPGVVDGTVRAPPSKSHTHRAYILAAMSGNGSLKNPLVSDDTEATLEGLRALGMLATQLPHETRIGGTFRPPRGALQARASGTTLRLLTGVAGLLPYPVTLTSDLQLARRPMGPLLSALSHLGVATSSSGGFAPVTVKGPMRGGQATVGGGTSSQFMSALLLACPSARKDTTLSVEGPQVSQPYIEITLRQLSHHGIKVESTEDGFWIPGGQRVRQKPYEIPGDYSSAAFMLAAACITGGRVRVEGLDPKDPQGDQAIVDHLRSFGARIEWDGPVLEASAGVLQGTTIDVGATPDLFPALAVVGAVARGTTRLTGAPHLGSKESDRIQAMATNLERAGVQVRPLPDGLEVQGTIPKGIAIASFDDHRVAMAMCVLALASKDSSVLPDPGVVAKSFPDFIHALRTLAPEAIRA